ncbi:MAG: hypothetical protein ACI8Y8_001364, partial [Planctomycetota bacterium]
HEVQHDQVGLESLEVARPLIPIRGPRDHETTK